MTIAVLIEREPGETRVALVPRDAAHLIQLGAGVVVEAGAGEKAGFRDALYKEAGAAVISDHAGLLAQADIVLGIHPPSPNQIEGTRRGAVQIGFLDPWRNRALVNRLAARGISGLALEFIPRSSRAQGMDALSSQSSLAGYVAVLMAARHLRKMLPMMTTAAGTVAAAKVFVIGAGVAGLQAIATARRLGAVVQAYDTRAEVADQIRSLGARPVQVKTLDQVSAADGYASALDATSTEQLRDALARYCVESDMVITTAQVFGHRAPLLLSRDTVARMAPGSVVVDLAVDTGGNVEGVTANAVSQVGDVTVITWKNLANRIPTTASPLFSANVTRLIEEFWNAKERRLALPLEDELIRSILLTHEGAVCHPRLIESFPKPTQPASRTRSEGYPDSRQTLKTS